jgi:hypothetical protein
MEDEKPKYISVLLKGRVQQSTLGCGGSNYTNMLPLHTDPPSLEERHFSQLVKV